MGNIQNAQRYYSIAPGRVNLLGEHIDYNDGIVLPVAIDRTVRIVAEPRSEPRVVLQAVDVNQSVEFELGSVGKRIDIRGEPLPSWACYPAGVAWVLQKHGYELRGFQATFTSNVPIGAGLGSSAAVEVAFASLWQELGRWQMDLMTLARLCQEAENRYVGVNCGLMDQFASANGVAEHALALDTRSNSWFPVPLPPKTSIVIADSGMRRGLTGSAYNDRRQSCEEAVRMLKNYLPGIKALRDVSPDEFSRYASTLPEVTRRRAQHVVEECARVNRALDFLRGGDAESFGKLMLAAHKSLSKLYEVSCPEVDALVEIAGRQPGCLGARLTGAGFGGCTVNLVWQDKANEFIERLTDGYLRTCGRQAEVYHCRASQGVKTGMLKL